MLKNNPYMKAYLNTIKEDINVEKCQQIAKIIGGEYDVETNTIDCKGNKVLFENGWLNEEGSFDFNLINTSNDWSYMFSKCFNLTHLPEEFIIQGDNVVNCKRMFYGCNHLKHLSKNFTIPEGVVNCYGMFDGCASLTNLPECFILPNSIKNCALMFYDCLYLEHLPEKFSIPNGTENCRSMFNRCMSLTHVPEGFTIPNSVEDTNLMFNECYDLKNNKDPNAYKMWEI